FEHARRIEHVRDAVFERALRGTADAAAETPASPQGVVQAFALAATGVPLSASALDRIEETPLPEVIDWTPQVRSSFLRILRSAEGGVRTLEAMDLAGVLGRL